MAQGAVVLSAPAPEPDGLNFILKVDPGYENDVFLTNLESARSSLATGNAPGEYLFNVKSGRVNSSDNLAALFNIYVVDDVLVEEEEEVEISLLPGQGVPHRWTVNGETSYRLTVPADANDTDSHTITWEAVTSVLGEDDTTVVDGIAVKLLVDNPLAGNTVVRMDVAGGIAVADVTDGAYDADAQTLAINAGADEVTLTIVSTGDVTGHARAVITITEFAGTGELPAGWSIAFRFCRRRVFGYRNFHSRRRPIARWRIAYGGGDCRGFKRGLRGFQTFFWNSDPTSSVPGFNMDSFVRWIRIAVLCFRSF